MILLSVILTIYGAAFVVFAGLLLQERLTTTHDRTLPAAHIRESFNLAVKRAVQDYDRDNVFAPIAPVVLFIVLPFAALANMLQGGSPFMIICYVSIVISVLAHLLLAEFRSAALIRAILSGLGAILAMVALPYYAVWSLTSHIMTASPMEGALGGIVIAVIVYAANAGIWSLAHTGVGRLRETETNRFMASMLFAVPIAYAAYWLGLLVLDGMGFDVTVWRGWTSLIAYSIFSGLFFALLRLILDSVQSGFAVCFSAALGVFAIAVALAIYWGGT